MSDDSLYLAGLLTVVMVFVVGFWAGKLVDARGADASNKTVGATAPTPALRCTNGPDPKAYTQAELESRYHAAKAYLATAESSGLWNDRGQRSVRLATAIMLEVLVCGP